MEEIRKRGLKHLDEFPLAITLIAKLANLHVVLTNIVYSSTPIMVIAYFDQQDFQFSFSQLGGI